MPVASASSATATSHQPNRRAGWLSCGEAANTAAAGTASATVGAHIESSLPKPKMPPTHAP